MTVAALPERQPGLFAEFLELTKFRISVASTFTATAGYVAFRRGVDLGLATTLAGILLLAMASCALNEVQERHLDAQMERTRNRPLPRGVFQPGSAVVLAVLLALAGFMILWAAHNLGSALLGALAMGWYNAFYTPLKRVSAFAVVPGALIGALPPAIGWTAAGGSLAYPAVLALAFVYFIWQVPHFWLLVGLHGRGYEAAGFPTLLRLLGPERLARLTFTWICGTAATCALLPLFGVLTGLPARLLLLGAAGWLVLSAAALLKGPVQEGLLRRAFMNINIFALLLTAAVVLDPFLPF
ncbi:MAG: protoheme IX farnesyltransferase [Acidobacteria bacterium]|nr:protoheme IX farnesyltransferase [Acidobacteriota bacterium]